MPKASAPEAHKYRYEPLNEENKRLWLETANRCWYSPINCLDESFFDSQLKKGSAAGVIIYETKTGRPLALFPGEIAERAVGPVRLRILVSRFGGLIVPDDEFSQVFSLKRFVFQRVIGRHYSKCLKIDCLDLMLPPRIMIEAPSCAHAIAPLYHSSAEINSILYAELDEDLMSRFKYNVRRETAMGLENMKGMRITREKDDEALRHILELDAAKASSLKIRQLSASYFESAFGSPFYHLLAAEASGRPASAILYTCCNGVGTFYYNASSDEGKRSFVNKGLLFTAMQDCLKRGARYFLLGNGWEHSDGRLRHEQIERTTFFKRSFSTNEAATYRFRCPLTRKGALMLGMKRIKDLNNTYE